MESNTDVGTDACDGPPKSPGPNVSGVPGGSGKGPPLYDVWIVDARSGNSNENLARFRRWRLYGSQFQRPRRTDPALYRDRAHVLGYDRLLRHQRSIRGLSRSIFIGRESVRLGSRGKPQLCPLSLGLLVSAAPPCAGSER